MRRPPRARRKQRAGIGSVLAVLLVGFALLFAENRDFIDFHSLLDSAASVVQASNASVADSVPEESAGTEVYFLDVGQGDCELVRIPNGEEFYNILIDTGEYEYADGLTEALQNLGVERIDRLICSHPHTDHMGCMARIVQRFEIGTVHMPLVADDMIPTTSAYEALLDAMLDKNLTAQQLCAGAQISCPAGVTLQVLAPEPDADWDDLNNYSGVIRLTYGSTSFLFTGDAEAASEKLIVQAAEQQGQSLSATVLKCGHHGSKTSSSAKFLKAVAPKYAVISCGADNSYGHPHDGTLEKFAKLGTKVYRTDQSGTILAKSDGISVTFEINLQSVKSRYANK